MNEEFAEDEREISLSDLWRTLLDRKWTIISITIIAVVVVLIYSFKTTPIYRSETILRVEKKSAVGQILDITTGELIPSSVEENINIIKGHSNFVEVAKRLNLKKNKYYSKLSTRMIPFVLEKQVSVQAVGRTNLIKISMESPDPVLARNVVSTLAQIYDEKMRNLEKSDYERSVEFIKQQLPQVKTKVDKAENAIRQMKEKYNFITFDTKANQLYTILNGYKSQYDSIEISLEESRRKLSAVQDELKGKEPMVVTSQTTTDNPIYKQLQSKLVDLNIQLVGLKNEYASKTAQIKAIEAQIESVKKQMNSEAQKIIGSETSSVDPTYRSLYQQAISLQVQISGYEAKLKALSTYIKDYQDQIARLPQLEQKLNQFERELNVNDQLYTRLLQKKSDAEIALASIANRTLIVEPATTPIKPVKPNKKLNLAIGGVLGIFLGVLLAFFQEYRDKTIRRVEQVEMTSGLPVLVQFAKAFTNPGPITLTDKVVDIEKYQMFTVDLMHQLGNNPLVGITSPTSSKDIPSIAVDISAALAENGYKALLVDADFKNKPLNKYFELGDSGFADVLMGEKSMDDVVMSYEKGFDIMGAGMLTENLNAILKRYDINETFENMKKKYEVVLINLSGILDTYESIVIAEKIKNTLIVVRYGETEQEALSIAKNKMQRAGINIVGVIMSSVPKNRLEKYI